MAEQFNADEVFEIAEQIERNGAKFYRRSAQVAGDPGARDLLVELADMEDRHERVFAAMREDLRRENPEWLSKFSGVDGESQAALYLRAVAEGLVFDLKGDPAADVSENTSLPSILETAIGLEKDSVVVYLGIKEAMPPDRGQEKLDDIIREEMGHIASLTQQLAALSG